MKKILIPGILLLLVLFSACGSELRAADAPLNEIGGELLSTYDNPEAAVLNEDYISLFYGIASEQYAEAWASRIARNNFPDELILFKAADEAAADEIEAQLQLHLDSAVEQSRDYEPETALIFEQCRVERDNLYVWLFLTEKRKDFDAAFLAHFQSYPQGEEPVFTMPPATPVPTAEPTPEPMEEPHKLEPLPYGTVPAAESVEDSYWDDVLFVGNSIGGNLEEYVTNQRMGPYPDCMGKCTLFTVVHFTYSKAIGNNGIADVTFPCIGGTHYTVEQALELTGANKVYLTLGYSDLVYNQKGDVSMIVDSMDVLISRLREVKSDVTIVISALIPRESLYDYTGYGNSRIRALNEALEAYAAPHSCYFIPCADTLMDETGGLKSEYVRNLTAEDGAHLNSAGAAVWLDWFYTHPVR